MVCQVITNAIGRDEEHWKPVLFDVVGGFASIIRTCHSGVLGNRSQTILHLVIGQVREDPKQRVQQRLSGGEEHDEHEELPGEEAHAQRAVLGNRQSGETRLEHPVRGHARSVTSELSPERRLDDRVEGIEEKVGLVWAELVSVMVGVATSIVVGAGAERQPTQNVDADDVVDRAVREQQSVGGLVTQDVHACLHDAHGDDGQSHGPPGVQLGHEPDDEHRCQEHRRDGSGVSQIVDLAQFSSELGPRATVGAKQIAAAELGRFGRDHSACHRRYEFVVSWCVHRGHSSTVRG